MTTLTREALLDKGKPVFRCVTIDELGGEVLIRPWSHARRAQRISQIFDSNGKVKKNCEGYDGIYRIIDCVFVDKSTPMFTDADLHFLAESPDEFTDALLGAIRKGEPESKKEESESGESS